jgi:hypothetical protein
VRGACVKAQRLDALNGLSSAPPQNRFPDSESEAQASGRTAVAVSMTPMERSLDPFAAAALMDPAFGA